MSRPDYTRIWLPRYFIKIGIAILLLSIITVIALALLYTDIKSEPGNHTTEMIKAAFVNLIILGLVFIVFSRGKQEDEKSVQKRLAGILGAFVTGITIVFISPVFDIFSTEKIEVIDSRQLIIVMLIMALVFKNSNKKHIEKQ